MKGFMDHRYPNGLLSAILSLGLLISIGLLPGCGLDAGLNSLRKVTPSTSMARVELEYIPDAVLVREDTMPRWSAGRFAFKRGEDRLLVLTNIISYAKIEKKKEVSRWDAKMERMWVTIPYDAQMGQELDLDDLEWNHLLGYDCGLIGDGQFAEPYRTSGKVTLLEDKGDRVAVYLNVLVAPRRQPNWSIKGIYEIPKTPDGVYGKVLTPGPKHWYEASGRFSNANDSTLPSSLRDRRGLTPPLINPPPLPSSSNSSSSSFPASQPSPATGSSPTSAPATAPADTQHSSSVSPNHEKEPSGSTAPSKSSGLGGVGGGGGERWQRKEPTRSTVAAISSQQLIGRWLRQTDQWYDRIQFENDGTFVFANGRSGGYEPAIHSGTYELRGDFLILKTVLYTYNSVNHPNISSELPKPVVSLVKVSMDQGELLLDGQMYSRGGLSSMHLRLQAAKYDDMRYASPPRMK